jgi:large subunit ribosomal protein L25
METIVAEKRDILGKKVKTLRAKGILPAVVYGKGKQAGNLAVSARNFFKLWKSVGESSIVNLMVNNENKNVLIHKIAFDPIKDQPIHVDFYEVDMNKSVQVDVQVEFIGESDAVKAGGVLVKVLHVLKVEALPKDLPHSIEVNLSVLKKTGDAISIKDIKAPNGVQLLDGPDDTVVLVEEPRKAEEPVEEDASITDIERVGDKEKEEKATQESEEKESENK